jgi:medium-chain acyl-[acyl-carrier-protein] hydrolase
MMGVVRPRPHAAPTLRLIAFHHAGGSAAMYHPWVTELPIDWDLVLVDLPGRGSRFTEPPVRELPRLVDLVVASIAPWLDAPVALFGHSLGALLAAEVARAYEARGAPMVWVGISGRVAPSLQGQTRRLSELSDDELLTELIALGGIPMRAVEHPELRAHFLRVVRADIAVLESYRPEPERAALRCPLTAFAGSTDMWAPPSTMRPWARETRSAFQLRTFDGGHFYFLGPALAGVARAIVDEVAPLLDGSAAPSRAVLEPVR